MTTDLIPYADVPNDSVLLKLATGFLPAELGVLPSAVPAEVQFMMECCWSQAPQRPTAQECKNILVDIASSPDDGGIRGRVLGPICPKLLWC